MNNVDVEVNDQGSVVMFTPRTQAAREFTYNSKIGSGLAWLLQLTIALRKPWLPGCRKMGWW
jgi:hypothetical protein